MKTVHRIEELRSMISAWRKAGESIAFVPTMGNLHDGHLSLVTEAGQRADRVVVSLFVNPMQFGPGEDIDNYPRTLEADSEHLQQQADLLFVPSVETMYPSPMETVTRVEVPGLSDILCGASRPGHFAGVATIVAKLFNMVQPDIAIFGQKDFQQLAIIRRMVSDLDMPVEIVGMPTVREADGLAMSSRNGYLDAEQRKLAPLIYQCLQDMANEIRQGNSGFETLAAATNDRLRAAGFGPDYCEIRRQQDLQPAQTDDRELVILLAARLGPARLIDNLAFER